jgi:hypothetical protein
VFRECFFVVCTSDIADDEVHIVSIILRALKWQNVDFFKPCNAKYLNLQNILHAYHVLILLMFMKVSLFNVALPLKFVQNCFVESLH